MKNNLLLPFYEIAKQSPDLIAASDSNGSITYFQLFENAQRFYHTISKHQIPHKKCALFLPNGIEAVSAIVSALTAGLCYTALDISTPPDRNSVICQFGDFDFVITNSDLFSEAIKFFPEERVLIYSETLKSGITNFDLIPDVTPADGAIMFFTSGSTGVPKAVVHSHGKLKLSIVNAEASFESNYCMIISLGFVASINIFFPLLSGGKISFFDIKKEGLGDFASFLKSEKITHVIMVVTAFRAMMQFFDEGEKLNSLKYLMLAGEPVQNADLELFKKITPEGSVLLQFYGTSETRTITYNHFGHNDSLTQKFSAGKPVLGIIIYILDESLKILSPGETGQIAVSSPLMPTEYYKDEEATRKSFIIHPETGNLMYLTGDVGYLSEEGNLFHLGRKDSMVKVRGNRVDILEIEECILSHQSVGNAIVVNKGDSFSDTLLVAYLKMKQPEDFKTIRAYVSSKLPSYMVPVFFIERDTLPQTITGKTDRKKLLEEPLDYHSLLSVGEDSQIEFDPLYQKLKTIWMEELKLPHLSPSHCFFNDLGGDSILAVMLLERIRKEISINLPYFILFRYRTLGKLTAYIHKGANELVTIEKLQAPGNDNAPVILFIPPIKGGSDTYNFATTSFPSYYGLYVLTYNIVDDSNKTFYPLNTILEAAAKMVSNTNWNNLYLYGYSIGGLLAFEIAQQTSKGKIKNVINIDIPPAFKKKRNLFLFIMNDIRLSFRSLLKGNLKPVGININHVFLCLRYCFIFDNRIRKFEFKDQLSLIEAAHLRYYMQFDHGKYDGDMFIIWSTEQQLFPKLFKWQKFVKGTIEEKFVESGHYDLLTGNKIPLTTELVVTAIDK
jgi:acyl-coenzyme A synthetase/AMP-(fatty) acid ligase/thioesterase domain-containing protein/acyl carrier protein